MVLGSDAAMSVDRRMRLWSQLVERSGGEKVTIEHVCAAAISAAGVDGAAVTVMLPASPRETLYASDSAASELEELMLTLGEGPGVDAWTGGPALVADLAASECLARWPIFAPAAVQAGVRAMFALPLAVGVIRLGVFDLYRAQAGGLERDLLGDLLLLADTACALLLDTGSTAGVRLHGDGPAQAGLQHPEVHQATGMLIVQLGVTAAVALMRLRAYAYTNERRLQDVASDVVARRLRFHPDVGVQGSGAE
jgi:hypothetical protein